MDIYLFIMYNNKIMVKKTKIIRPEDVRPQVMVSNYFQLKTERSWGPRTISEYELIYIVAGEFSYTEMTFNRKYELFEGDILCIHPGVKHIFRNEKTPSYGAIISCIHLELVKGSFRLKKDYQPEIEPPVITSVKGDYALHQLFRNCSRIKEGFSRYREALLENIGRDIWLRLAEYWEGANISRINPRTRKMLSFIESKIPGEVTRNELSRHFGLTPEHINAVFKQETGLTPTQAVHRARINLACRYLLEEGLSIKETAAKVGFSDEFYFSKVFKKIMSIPPGKITGR